MQLAYYTYSVCYYNVRPAGKNAPPLPDGYACHKPVPGMKGWYEECWYDERAVRAK